MIDISQIINPIFTQLWWFIPLFIAIAIFKFFKPFLKGKLGEFAVSMHVKRYLNDDYVLLNDCTLPDDRGGTTQIDHILISPYGVFVIETQNYKGWIFGSAHQKNGHSKFIKKDLNFKIR